MNKMVMLIAVLVLAGTAHAAQLYRWVDDKGRVEWRDTPPPASAKKVERRTVGGSVIETTALPYSVQQAVKNFPLTLYTNECGDSCSKARAHLNRRGLPFTEKNPEEDIEGFRKLTGGSLGVPMLFVGRETLKGYQEEMWDNALDNAGYPRSVAGARPQPAPKPAAAPVKPPAEPAAGTAPAAPPAAAPQTPAS